MSFFLQDLLLIVNILHLHDIRNNYMFVAITMVKLITGHHYQTFLTIVEYLNNFTFHTKEL